MKPRPLPTPLRYPGGKSKAIKKLFEHFPDLRNVKEYREPFLGGGSVALAITKKNPNIEVWVNDLYWPLYNFWMILQKDGEELASYLHGLKIINKTPDMARSLFKDAKRRLNDTNEGLFYRAAAFYIINKCSFSGLTESSSFSSLASNGNFTIQSIEDLREYSKLIKNWKITNQDYVKLFALNPLRGHAFIYLDPPYEISSNLYGKKGAMHKGFDHDKFARDCHLSEPYFDMAISYNADQKVKDRFDTDWNQVEFDLAYTMRSNSANYRKNQKNRKELLLTNYT